MTVSEEETEIIEDTSNLNNDFYDDRESVLNRLDEVIKIAYEKVISGRVRDPDKEKVRIAWIKALAYTCSIYNQIKKDIDMEELQEEMETLKNQINNMEKLGE